MPYSLFFSPAAYGLLLFIFSLPFGVKGQRFPRGQEKVTLLLCATQTLRGRLLFSRRAKERSPKKELGQQSLGAIDIHYELLGAIDIHYELLGASRRALISIIPKGLRSTLEGRIIPGSSGIIGLRLSP